MLGENELRALCTYSVHTEKSMLLSKVREKINKIKLNKGILLKSKTMKIKVANVALNVRSTVHNVFMTNDEMMHCSKPCGQIGSLLEKFLVWHGLF